MVNTTKIISLIREIVRHEVKKEVKKIFIKENVKSTSVKLQPKKFKKEVSYTKNPMLNKILNETAQSQEFEEYPTSVNDVPEHVTKALTKDYRDVMKAINKKKSV